MKIKNLILVILSFISFSVFAQSYNDGYEAGYKEGYCFNDFGCISPIPPVAPVPYVGQDTYKDGYNRGFKDGSAAKNGKESSERKSYYNEDLVKGARDAAPKYNDIGKSFSDGFNKGLGATMAASGGSFLMVGERQGNRGISFSLGYNDGTLVGLDMFFNKISVGIRYVERLYFETDTYSEFQTDIAGTLGYKINNKTYLKAGIGAAYLEPPVGSYGSIPSSAYDYTEETSFSLGFQWFFKLGFIGLTPEVFYSSTGGIGFAAGLAL